MSLSRDCILSRLFESDFVATSVAVLRSDIFLIIDLEDQGFLIRRIFCDLTNCNITIPNYIRIGVPQTGCTLRFISFEDQFLTIVFNKRFPIRGYVIIGSSIFPYEKHRFKIDCRSGATWISYKTAGLNECKECLFD